MLFSRNKEKNGNLAFETPPSVEEETVRRWRDIAAARAQRSLFEDEDELRFTAPNSQAPAWPSSSTELPPYPMEMSYQHEVHNAETESLAMDAEPTFELRDNVEDTLVNEPIEQHLPLEPEDQPTGEFEIPSNFRVMPAAERTIGRFHNHKPQPSNTMPHPAPTTSVQPLSNQIQKTHSNQSSNMTSDLSLPIEQDLKRRFGTNIRSALGPGTVIEGTFRFDSPVCVDGTLTGEITSTSALIVGSEASINGNIKVGSLIVLGTVNGSIESDELVEIRSGGMLEADIKTKRIVIEDGGWFNGRVTMSNS